MTIFAFPGAKRFYSISASVSRASVSVTYDNGMDPARVAANVGRFKVARENQALEKNLYLSIPIVSIQK